MILFFLKKKKRIKIDYELINFLEKESVLLKHVVRFDKISVQELYELGITTIVSSYYLEEFKDYIKQNKIVTILLGNNFDNRADLCISLIEKRYLKSKIQGVKYIKTEKFLSILEMVKMLSWDSNFFGFNVGYISSNYLTENIYQNVEKFLINNKTKVAYFLCDCHDRETVKIAQNNGFDFVDIRLSFLKKNISFSKVELSEMKFQKANENDLNKFDYIVDDMYRESRYFFDGNFDPKKLNDFYKGWLNKAILGLFDDECYYISIKGEIGSFCTIRYISDKIATIGLVGVNKSYLGQKLGELTLKLTQNQLIKKGIKTINVVTQGRNFHAINLYQNNNFLLDETQVWYHKWFT